ncbi:MAG TPA: hypothetical protein VLA21_12335 [Candidatus Limnocylindria bacterium]|nr:hypothetical protein [Candidatus Limnocylindria bacterium]
MMRALFAVQLQAVYSQVFNFGTKKKKRTALSKVLIALLVVYIFAALGSSIGLFYHSLYQPLRDAGLRWLYFALGGLTAFILSFIGSMFLAQSTLYEAKDNEMLLSLPIPPGTILASRFAMVLFSAFVMQQVALLPAAVVWWLYGPVSPVGVLMYVLASAALPFMAAALSGLGGYLLMLAAARVRRKSLVLTLMSLAFLGAYFYGYTRLQGLMATLAAQGAQIADIISGAMFPAYHFGLAIDTGSAVSLLLFAASALVPFALVYLLIGSRYLRMLTDKRGEKKQAYVSAEMKATGPFLALVRREVGRFTSSATYMMNSALGLAFMPVFPVLLVVNAEWRQALSGFGFAGATLAAAVAVVLCMLCASVFISAPSVSLEGRSFWIVRTLPVTPLMTVLSKAAAHFLLTLPFQLLSALLASILLKASFADALALFLLPVPVIAFTALLGVALNLRFPKLVWRTITEPVKQGVSSILSMFGAMVTVAAPVALWFFLLRDSVGPHLFMVLYAALFAALSALLYLHLRRAAPKALLALGEQ